MTSTAPTAPTAPTPGPRDRITLLARVVPVVALAALVAVWGRNLPPLVEVVVVILLAGAVLAAVHHAEVVAHRVGEPFGSLILAVAVTVIEVGLIITLMVGGGPGTESLARDTVFAAVMITCNGIVGLSLLATALQRRVAVFNPEGTGAALATVITLATLSLVLPTFTTSSPGPEFTGPQLGFAAVASLTLYGLFVFVQNVRHRDYFLPISVERSFGMKLLHRPGPQLPWARLIAAPRVPTPTEKPVTKRPDPHQGAPQQAIPEWAGSTATAGGGDPLDDPETSEAAHAEAPPMSTALTSLVLLIVALLAVVGLAKVESTTIEEAVRGAGLPHAVVGVAIALLVLLPETLAAVRNARRNRVQISLNLALGSAMASIGLTIPAITIASLWLEGPLVLGLGATQIVLLGLTAGVGILTVMPGRATLLQGAVHLALCGAFFFLAAVP